MSSEAPTPMIPKAANATVNDPGRLKLKPSARFFRVIAYGVNCSAITAVIVHSVKATTIHVDAASTKR